MGLMMAHSSTVPTLMADGWLLRLLFGLRSPHRMQWDEYMYMRGYWNV